MDRNTGQIVSDGDNRPFPIASVVKLFIADDLLLQVSEGKTTAIRSRPQVARHHAAFLR